MATRGKEPVLQNVFLNTTPIAYERAGGNPTALSALTAIERRADALKARAVTHAKAFEDRWTAKEAIHLWKRYVASQDTHPAPTNAIQEISPEAVMKTAARHVQARTQRRLAKINAIKTRMGNAMIRSLETRNLSQHFTEAAPSVAEAQPSNRRAMRNKQ